MKRKPSSILLVVLALALGLGPTLYSQSLQEEAWEIGVNSRQPPDKVLEAIGVRPGMVVGEVGAGRGRYTVHLARKIGDTGKVYANDIDQKSLDYLSDRCRRGGLRNVEIVKGAVDDPLFPRASLDLAFMILTYHHLAKPVDLLRNLIPSLKPGALLAIVEPDPIKDADRGGRESTSLEEMTADAGQAGYDLVRVETFLAKDNIFILRVKPTPPPIPPDSKDRTDNRRWTVVNRQMIEVVEAGRRFVRLDERAGSGLAWLEGSRFSEGTIEFDVRGKDAAQKSFVGIAFHRLDDTTFEAVYFRPFNFLDPDPAKAGHSVQYVSHPDFTWQKLRAERPGEFENAVAPVPDPNGWFHVRVDVGPSRVSVTVNAASQPCLSVDKPGRLSDGPVGLFVGNGSGGDFSDLVVVRSK